MISMQPLISVIIPVYNVEKYIAECLDSVVNQSIGEDKLEIIVVDDKTPDNSMDIVREYAKRYNNIKIIEHSQNKGLGSARNTGLKSARGKYIAFLDSDDILGLNVFRHLIPIMEKHQLPMAIYEFVYFSNLGKVYPRNPSAVLFAENKIIQNFEYPAYPELTFALSACHKIFRRSFLEESSKFPESNKLFEDTALSIELLLKADKLFITNRVKYYYRKHEDPKNPSKIDSVFKTEQSFWDAMDELFKIKEIIKAYPYMTSTFDWFFVRYIITFFERWALGTPFYSSSGLVRHMKMFLFFLFPNIKKYLFVSKDQEFLNQLKNLLKDVDKDNLYEDRPEYQILLTSVQNSISVGQVRRKYILFKYIQTLLQKLRSIINLARLLTRKFKTAVRVLRTVVEVFYVRLTNRFILRDLKGQDIWLISERGDEAKDNAFKLFKYIRKNFPDRPVYYLYKGDETTVDYQKLKELGNIIEHRSMMHKRLYMYATKVISTHSHGAVEPWGFKILKKFIPNLFFGKKFVFLQHGITKDFLVRDLGAKAPSAGFNLFICGGKLEYEYIAQFFGYGKNEITYTGFARYDTLQDKPVKQPFILFMPTWRSYIVKKHWIKDDSVSDDQFLKSTYFKHIAGLLNNSDLDKLLEKNDLILKFYPHYEVQQYLHYFTKISNRIQILDKEHYDVQELLKTARLLITDYSSVFFDFAYMYKPVIYYQFDQDEFFKKHYAPGYFSYEINGYGPVLKKEAQVVEAVEHYVKNNFRMEKKYRKRVDEMFLYRDQNNCKRIFEAIEAL